jgi:hypothetical protein
MFVRSGIDPSSLQQAIILNPQNPVLLSATSGKATFLTTTLDPTLQRALSRNVVLYFLGGFGWFRRTIDFTGVSTEGKLLQPNSPAVYAQAANSGVADAGFGVNIRLSKQRAVPNLFVEGRVLRGLAINGGTTLVPVSAGIRW